MCKISKIITILGLSVAAAIHCKAEGPLVPDLPTIFFLSRQSNPYDSKLPKGEKSTTENAQAIVDAALKIMQIQRNPSEQWENIIILDEGECWFVSFHARGNGNIKSLKVNSATIDPSYSYALNSNAGIYLDKKSLAKATRIPCSPIQSLPMISPLADGIMATGSVLIER